MSFRSYTNILSQTSKSIGWGIFTTGLGLIGFGLLIYLLPKVFATLAAIVFFMIGFGCVSTAIKILLAQRRIDKIHPDNSEAYRKNVQIHIDEHFDL